MCDLNGGIIDDIIIYKKENEFMMVVNASNIEKNFQWLKSVLINDVQIKNSSQEIGLIAIQGPFSRKVLQSIIKQDISGLPFFHFIDEIEILGHKVLLSRVPSISMLLMLNHPYKRVNLFHMQLVADPPLTEMAGNLLAYVPQTCG